MSNLSWLSDAQRACLGMAFANLGIVPGTPDVTFDAEVLLSKLVDQAREGPKETFFLRVRNVAKVVFGHPWYGVRGCQRIQQHPGVVGAHADESVGEIGP